MRFLIVTLGLALAAVLPSAAPAQEKYPQRPIHLIVPYAPGGSVDIIARLIGETWGAALGQPLVIENKAGAGGNLGVDAVAKAPADGYTIGIQSVSLAMNPALFKKMPFDTLTDLAPIGMVASSQHVLVVKPSLAARDVRGLLAMAKAKPDGMNYASAGPGSTLHMSAELFKSMAGVEIMHVPYRGGGPALADTIGGQVDMSFPVLSAAEQQVKAGKLRALGVTGPKRSALLPDVPTIAEAGVPGYEFETWFMVFAPARTPAAAIATLNASLNRTLSEPAFAAKLVERGFEPMTSTPAQARDRLVSESAIWGKLIKERGITGE